MIVKNGARVIFLFCSIFVITLPVIAQENPRIAVIPLNPVSVSKAEADTLSALLETGLVNTGIFDVIEQTQVVDIIEAQEYSLSDCTDEGCAVEFGKLLAAEQIVLGSVSQIGTKYVIAAKIIDVRTAKNIKADSIEATSLEELTDGVKLLAFKLAGLTYETGTEIQIATAFGEVFVETTPDEAEVFVNGINKGLSPLIVEKVPVGSAIVEARKDDLYASQQLVVTGEDLMRVSLALEIRQGRLFIQVSEKDVAVTLGETNLGSLGSGLFEDIPPGEYPLVLEGDGLYWESTVKIVPDQIVRIQAYPREVGGIRYTLPEGAKAEISGKNFRKVVHDTGELGHIPVGTYTAVSSGEIYEAQTQTFEVKKSGLILLQPDLAYTLEHRNKLERRVTLSRITELQTELEVLNNAYQEAQKRQRTHRILGGLGTGTGLVALSGMGLFIYFAEIAYDQYISAPDTPTALQYGSDLSRWETLTVVSAITGGVLGLSGAIALGTQGNLKGIRTQIAALSKELERLQESVE